MSTVKDNFQTADKTNFSSFLTAVLALAGATIGMGNFWRFPYMMGSHGGSAFLLIFLVCLFLVGIPAVIAELTMARMHRKSTIAILSNIYGPFGFFVGHAIVLGMLLMLSYYILVVGNMCYAAGFSVIHGLSWDSLDAFDKGLKNNNLQFFVSFISTWLSVLIVYMGIKRGIERCSNIIVPFFFLSILYLVYIALTQAGAVTHLRNFIIPDFSNIGFKEVFAALGQCFYSMALGGLVLVAYGRHLQKENDLPKMSISAAFSDTSASILTSLFIVPTVLIFGLQLDSGPTLVFETLPRLFSEMATGETLAGLMMLSMASMAVLSLVGAIQFIFEALADIPFWGRMGRKKLLLLIGFIGTATSVIPAYQPGALAKMDLVIGSAMPIIGSLFLIVGMMWFSDRRAVLAEIYVGKPISIFNVVFLFWVKWVVPAVLIFILLGTLYEFI